MMTIDTIETIRRHFLDLENDRVPPREKPSAFHHGLLRTALADLERLTAVLEECHRIADAAKDGFESDAVDAIYTIETVAREGLTAISGKQDSDD